MFATILNLFQTITNSSIVKDIIVLQPLRLALPESLIDIALKNQCAGLEDILYCDARD
jgi:hypothetical protein